MISSVSSSSTTFTPAIPWHTEESSSFSFASFTQDSTSLSSTAQTDLFQVPTSTSAQPQDADTLRTQKSQLQGEVGELKGELDANQAQLNERRAAVTQDNTGTAGNAEEARDYQQAQTDFENARSAKAQAQQQLTAAQQEQTSTGQARSANSQSQQQVNADLSAAQSSLASLTPPDAPQGAQDAKDYEGKMQAYQSQKATLESQVATLTQQQKQLEAESQQLQSKQAQLEQTIQEQSDAVAEQDALMQDAQARLDSVHQSNLESNPQLQQALDDDSEMQQIQSERESLQQTLSAKEAELQQIESQLASAESQAAQASEVQADPAALRQEGTSNEANAMLDEMGDMVGMSAQHPEDTEALNDITQGSGIDCTTTPWNAAYAMNELADHGVLDTSTCPNVNHCPTVENWAKEEGLWQDGGADSDYQPHSGDAIFLDCQNNGDSNHMGIVEGVKDGRVYTIEGNSNGAVQRRCYALDDPQVRGYIDCGATDQSGLTGTEILEQAKDLSGYEGDILEYSDVLNIASTHANRAALGGSGVSGIANLGLGVTQVANGVRNGDAQETATGLGSISDGINDGTSLMSTLSDMDHAVPLSSKTLGQIDLGTTGVSSVLGTAVGVSELYQGVQEGDVHQSLAGVGDLASGVEGNAALLGKVLPNGATAAAEAGAAGTSTASTVLGAVGKGAGVVGAGVSLVTGTMDIVEGVQKDDKLEVASGALSVASGVAVGAAALGCVCPPLMVFGVVCMVAKVGVDVYRASHD